MFDVIVIGGGHAGVEAAAAASRRGARVALVTFRNADVGQMSCNPSVGGVGKGHLVREIDAMGGIMAAAADRSAIHRRMLNASKGSAVWGPRVQADRKIFRQSVQAALPNVVQIIEGEVGGLIMMNGRVAGVELADGQILHCAAVVLSTGTFLGATLFRGEQRWHGGRLGGKASLPLADQVAELGLATGRLKTGTPPRIDARSIDWSAVAPQPSDRDAWTLSIEENPVPLPQLSCAITRTTAQTHDIIRDGLGRSPLFAGAIEGRGPRYCPSIEDKIVRFGDRDGHQIFLEPEGLDDDLVYPNGISTSLPADVQEALVRSIPGLERARIVEYGYAVEYQYGDPRRLRPSLEHSELHGLFFAGQINGTTGYEEAGAQGLVAGANAAAVAKDLAPLVLDRANSYAGVMIDDLTLQGVSEPYRMLTARSEFRLHLRADNAVTRLGRLAEELGLLTEDRAALIRQRRHEKVVAERMLEDRYDARAVGAEGGDRKPLRDWVRRDDLIEAVNRLLPSTAGASEAIDDAIYEPYLERQRSEHAARSRDVLVRIPDGFDYSVVPGLSNEMRERLADARPSNLDQASRLAGVTPAALSALHFALVRRAA